LDGADEFAVVLFDGEDLDAAAEGGDDVEQGGAGGVHAEGVEDEVGVGEEERGAEEEGGGGDVAGDGGVDGLEFLVAGDGEFGGLVGAACGRAGEGCSEGAEGMLGVVAGEDGFGEAGCAFSLQAGEVCAPIWARGLRMRSMGRGVRDESPMRVKVCGWEAMRPANMRMVEPELPQSRGAVGWRNAPATPVTSMTAAGPLPVVVTVAPRAAMHAREEWGSAPVEKLERREVPSPRPASIA
jgi:hypothetical protein